MSQENIRVVERRIREMLESADAIWTYEGTPRASRPHALLTSGLHSDGYANAGDFLKNHASERYEIAVYLLEALAERYNLGFTAVVGADTSSTDLAKDVANIAGVKHIRMVKSEVAGEKCQMWHESNLLETGCFNKILHVEELVATASSAQQVRRGIRQQVNPITAATTSFVPFMPIVVDRSNPDHRIESILGSTILPLLRLTIRNFNPEMCPYCVAGSEAIKPKEGDNWSKLTDK